MASKSTNKAIEALERRHVAERAALKTAADAGAAVRRAQERRAAELARLDEMVAEAERGADVALAVLASLMAPDVAAVLTEEAPARVRLGQQRAPVEDVTERVGQLTGGAPLVRRRGRPRRSVQPAHREPDDRPSTGVVVASGPGASPVAAGPLAAVAPSSEGR